MARWPLVSLLTPFLEPFIELGLALALLIVAVVALIHGFRRQQPFNAIYPKANFKLLERHRTTVAQQILAGRRGTLVRSGGRGDQLSLE
jgi:hypothetical protein